MGKTVSKQSRMNAMWSLENGGWILGGWLGQKGQKLSAAISYKISYAFPSLNTMAC